jgi:hypothetical protein
LLDLVMCIDRSYVLLLLCKPVRKHHSLMSAIQTEMHKALFEYVIHCLVKTEWHVEGIVPGHLWEQCIETLFFQKRHVWKFENVTGL